MTKFLYANNAASTLAGAITNIATTATLSPGSGAEFPDPGAGEQFALTFTDAATGLLNEIVYVTDRTGDVITMLRAQEGTTALAWSAGDNADALITAGGLDAMVQGTTSGVRTLLTANTSFYIDPAGSNSNDGLTALTPWQTVQYAYNYLQAHYDLGSFQADFILANGTYAGAFAANGPIVGQNSELLIHAPGTSSGCSYTGGISANLGANISVSNFNMAGSFALSASDNANITVRSGMLFSACSGFHMAAQNGGLINLTNNYDIGGSSPAHWAVNNNGRIMVGAITITHDGVYAYSTAFANVLNASLISFNTTPAVFAGTNPTGTRYTVQNNSVIQTNGAGANYLPGNGAGNSATGGQYN